MYFLQYWGMLSGGAIGALFVGLITSNFWEKGFPARLSSGPSFEYSPQRKKLCAFFFELGIQRVTASSSDQVNA